MQRFFFDDETVEGGAFTVVGEKHNHIVKVLRMAVGEKAVFCDGNMTDYLCELTSCDKSSAEFRVLSKEQNTTEPTVRITIFQCLTKGEKMDDMVKRCVQFGAYEIVPVLSRRCVARPDKKGAAKKVERLNKIARSSAMQSMRGIIPRVADTVDFGTALDMMKSYDSSYICYEDEHGLVINKSALKGSRIAILVGPEGGIDESEVAEASARGIGCMSLGRRILRTEDAAAFAIPIILSLTQNL